MKNLPVKNLSKISTELKKLIPFYFDLTSKMEPFRKLPQEENLLYYFDWTCNLFVPEGIKFYEHFKNISLDRCAESLLINDLKEGKTHRFIGGDPKVFVAEVIGIVELTEERKRLHLKLKSGIQMFWIICNEKCLYLELAKDQSNLDVID
jgi:hypothetical protein